MKKQQLIVAFTGVLLVTLLVAHRVGWLPLALVFGASGWILRWTERKQSRKLNADAPLINVQSNTLIDAELAEWKERSAAAEALTAQLQEQVSSLQERVSDQEAQIAENASRWDLYSVLTEEAQAQIQEAQTKESAAQAECSQIRMEREELSDQVASLADELAGQVVVSLSEAEQAISTAIEAFTRIASEAQTAAELAQSAVGTDSDHTVAKVASQATLVMETFIQGMLTSSRQIADSSRQLERLIGFSQGLTRLLDDVQAVADQTDIISINASIEAARAGDAGRTFSVVATEVRKLADRSRAAAERMRGITQDLMGETKTIYTTLGLTAEGSLEASCNAQNEVNQLARLLCAADERTRDILAQLSEKSVNITANYTSIITAFQFHDLLRQRLEHVAEPLTQLGNSMRGETPQADTLGKLAYSVGNRSFQARAVGMAPTLDVVTYAPSDDDNITLF